MTSSPAPGGPPTTGFVMGVDQALREAYIDARLARDWHAHGHVWARTSIHGIEVALEPLEAYEGRWVIEVGGGCKCGVTARWLWSCWRAKRMCVCVCEGGGRMAHG